MVSLRKHDDASIEKIDGNDKLRSNNRHPAPTPRMRKSPENTPLQPTVANVDVLLSQTAHLIVHVLNSCPPEERPATQEKICRLFFSKTNELLKIVDFTPTPDEEGQVDPAYIAIAFAKLIQEQDNDYVLKPGTPPSRARRLWHVFRGRENNVVSMDVLVREFSDTADPQNSARTAISRINRSFSKLGLHLFIDHVTAYRLRFRS